MNGFNEPFSGTRQSEHDAPVDIRPRIKGLVKQVLGEGAHQRSFKGLAQIEQANFQVIACSLFR